MTPSPEPADDRTAARTRARWAYGGFAAGLAVGGLVSAVQLAREGWGILPIKPVHHLLWAPYLGLVIGHNLCPARRPGWPSWRNVRLRTRTLMVWVAYVALLFGLGVSTQRIGASARVYSGKFVTASQLAEVYRTQAEKSERDSKTRLSAAATLCDGGIPDSLTPGQKAFLRELDKSDDPEYRRVRRGLIAETEDSLGRQQERTAEVLRTLARHQQALADKYDRARRRPWLPVTPDPPPTGAGRVPAPSRQGRSKVEFWGPLSQVVKSGRSQNHGWDDRPWGVGPQNNVALRSLAL